MFLFNLYNLQHKLILNAIFTSLLIKKQNLVRKIWFNLCILFKNQVQKVVFFFNKSWYFSWITVCCFFLLIEAPVFPMKLFIASSSTWKLTQQLTRLLGHCYKTGNIEDYYRLCGRLISSKSKSISRLSALSRIFIDHE